MDPIEDENQPQEEQRQENIRIYNRLNNIVATFAPESEGQSGSLRFQLHGVFPVEVDIQKEMRRSGESTYDFRTNDIITHQDTRFNPKERVATPYGVIPQLVIGSDGQLYGIFDDYWLTPRGQIGKIIYIHNESHKMPGKTPQDILREKFHLDEEEIDRIKTLEQKPILRYKYSGIV